MIVEVVGDVSDLEKKFARAQKASRGFGRDVERSGRSFVVASRGASALSGAVAGATAGLLAGGGLIIGLNKTIDAAQEAQTVGAQLTNVLEQQGKATAANQRAIEQRTQALSQMAGVDDELLGTTFTAFERQTNDITKALKLNALAVDVARGRNISLQAAAGLVTKANLGMAGSLRRVGIDARAGASSVELLDLLQRKFAGSAEAYGKTAAGAQERFHVALENTEELIGSALLPALTRLLTRASDWLNNQKNQKRIQDTVTDAVDKGERAAGFLANTYGKLRSAVAFVHDNDPFGGKSLRDFAKAAGQANTAADKLAKTFADLRTAQKRVADGYSAIENARQGAQATLTGQAARNVAGLLPGNVSGSSFVGRPLTASEQLAITLAGNPDDVGALQQQRSQRKRAFDFAQRMIREQRGNTAKFAEAAARLAGDITAINQRLASIAAEKAAAAKAARDKARAAFESQRQDVIDAIGSVTGGTSFAPGAFERFQATVKLPAVVSGTANALSAVQAAQLKVLEPPDPTAKSLKARARSLARKIRGTDADTPANRATLARVQAAFALGQPRGEVAQQIARMLDDVQGDVGGSTRAHTPQVTANIRQLIQGTGLRGAGLRQLEFNLAGAHLTQLPGGVGPRLPLLGGHTEVRVFVGGREVAAHVETEQKKAKRRTATQTRGRVLP